MSTTTSNYPNESIKQSSLYSTRQDQLVAAFEDAGLDAMVLNPGPSLTYMTGLHFHLSERPIVTIFSSRAPMVVVLPELESAKVKNLSYEAQIFTYGEDPAGWGKVFQQAALSAGIDELKIGVEPGRLRVLELRYLEDAAPKAYFISAEDSIAALRMRKDNNEVALMRRAAQIAQKALLATIPSIKPGATERQIASELVAQLLHAGSESPFPFSPIVSSGPNSANPHATPSDRALKPGDLLVIDWGAAYHGYVSDITRTFAIAPVEDELAHIAQLVLKANLAGRAAAGPGIPAEAVDQAARQVIEGAGYGQYFFHRTGHGLGMEGHEGPYIRAGNRMLLEPGMTFTVEPGIYIHERGGVRIEDDVVITSSGAESLTDMPRELYIID